MLDTCWVVTGWMAIAMPLTNAARGCNWQFLNRVSVEEPGARGHALQAFQVNEGGSGGSRLD